MISPELLMPAGDIQKLKYAFVYGADAVYLGVPKYSLRARENEIDLEGLKEGIDYAHSLGKKVYVTANIFSRNRKLKPFLPQLADWLSAKPDALIMSDPGLMMLVRERYPDVPIHLSVQANCMNWQSALFWKKSLNIERVILSREMSLEEITEVKNRVPDLELEAFVHGAICIAYSGRCLMSSYMSYRDANQGVCDNSCREKYKIQVEDLRTPGEFYSLEENDEGTYLFNAKDLCLIEHLRDLINAGVCSFKVEGRTKSVNYVSQVARVYRQAIDDALAGRDFNPELRQELEKISNRGYHEGFLMKEPSSGGQNYLTSRTSTQTFAGLVKGPLNGDGFLPIEVRGTFKVGQTLEVLGPRMKYKIFQVKRILSPKNKEVETAHSGSGDYWVSGCDVAIENGIVSLVK